MEGFNKDDSERFELIISPISQTTNPLELKIKQQQETIDELTKFISAYEVEKRK